MKKNIYSKINDNFIPYACHYNKDTILTKNGNLCQTLKITGFEFELVGKEKKDLRTSIREIIKEHIKDDHFAVYLHTIRRKKNLGFVYQSDNYFCNYLNDGWNKLHNWQNKYVNELYITIITKENTYSLKKLSNFLLSLSFFTLKLKERSFLKKTCKKLTELVDDINKSLANFGAKKLIIAKRDLVKGEIEKDSKKDIYYSEPLRFFNKILNLEDKNFPIKEEDLSTQICYSNIVFGNNVFKITNDKKKHFGAILSIKEYNDLPLILLDKFFNAPIELIVTQSLDFVNSDKIEELYKEQKKIIEASKDYKFAENIGLGFLDKEGKKNINDYGEQQLTIMLFASDKEKLEKIIEKSAKTLMNNGLVVVREDIFMEHCYFSQLPGNFFYLKRKNYHLVSTFAGFASLQNYPAGKKNNNKWGDAVTVFYTKNKTPYFFNFHYKGNGHSLIVGNYGTGKTVLLNFLIAQAQKFKNKLYYFDFSNSSKIFINALSGKYYDFSLEEKLFNPCSLLKKKDFFIQFISVLIIEKEDFIKGQHKIAEKKKNFLNNLYEKIKDKEINRLSELKSYFQDTIYQNFFLKWCENGKYANIFDNKEDIWQKGGIVAFDFTDLEHNLAVLVPIILHSIYKIEENLTGEPTIIVLDEAFKLLDNVFLAPEIEGFLQRVRKKNAIVVMAQESVDDISNSHITDLLMKEISTSFYLANESVRDIYKKIFRLNKEECKMLDSIKNESRHFLLKHGNDSLVAQLDLQDLLDAVLILSSDKEAVEHWQEIKEHTGNKLEEWFPKLQELLNKTNV